jgi:HSP20 family protein
MELKHRHHDLDILEEMRSMSDESLHWRLRMRSSTWRPPTDVYETDDHIIVRVEIGGMKEDDFKVELTGHVLTIRGFRQDVNKQPAYHQVEIRFGEFYIEIHLPAPVQASDVEADYANGFLRVSLPKVRSTQIRVDE